MAPGVAFLVWGAWWAYNVAAAYLLRSPGRPYRSRAWFPLGVRGLWYAEPVLKLLVPLAAISVELFFDHQLHFQ